MIKTIVNELCRRIQDVPDGFYDSFEYTRTGRNLTHPVTIGFLVDIVRRLPRVVFVGVDVRFNEDGGTKFQPDVVGFDSRMKPVVMIDYESPNSSDARIPQKDVRAYLDSSKAGVPYVVITTLPKCPAPGWELRYASRGSANEGFKGKREAIRKNPFEFWYGCYRRKMGKWNLRGVRFLNIDGKTVRAVRMP